MAPSGRRCSQTIPFPPLPPPPPARRHPSPRRRLRRRLPPPPTRPSLRPPLPRATLRQPLYHTFVYTSLSHRSLCNPLSSFLAILATSTTPSVAFYPARTNTAPLPRCISFSPLFFPFTSPPPHSLAQQPRRNATLNPRFT